MQVPEDYWEGREDKFREMQDEIERLKAIKASREDVLGEKIGEIVKLRGLLDKAVRSLCLDDYTEQQAVASEIAAIHQQKTP